MPSTGVRDVILDAARDGLLSQGYSGLSTRSIAHVADVPLSQLHYHFGGKQQLILSMLERENARLLERQSRMYGEDRPLWQRYDQACDFLDEDMASGYVRVLQEMMAAGWANPEVAVAVRRILTGWQDVLTGVLEEFERTHGRLGPFTAVDAATLVVLVFLGGESLLLLGLESERMPIRGALRAIGDLIRQVEEGEAA